MGTKQWLRLMEAQKYGNDKNRSQANTSSLGHCCRLHLAITRPQCRKAVSTIALALPNQGITKIQRPVFRVRSSLHLAQLELVVFSLVP
ncbi:uncharacterized protein SPSK_10158 [Sporothrix schenckii 1099-18]|uniref:Uncharacterized protein n=1 Tax=Sporothrix schenckii 1099-18 TaxID=1397361 RepID=A0A0F2M584_SPOSC|nr:uncharacterized protein SPSK_10158 [Sporothrix schenckii 1099-18]KJR84787.1 hypothetical protein SPSK_10158 [Sporothrix schenckii 1099-18]